MLCLLKTLVKKSKSQQCSQLYHSNLSLLKHSFFLLPNHTYYLVSSDLSTLHSRTFYQSLFIKKAFPSSVCTPDTCSSSGSCGSPSTTVLLFRQSLLPICSTAAQHYTTLHKCLCAPWRLTLSGLWYRVGPGAKVNELHLHLMSLLTYFSFPHSAVIPYHCCCVWGVGWCPMA